MASLPAHARSFERRIDDRTRINRPAMLYVGNTASEIRIEDLTRDGCGIATDAELEPGSTVTLGIAGVGRKQAKVTWRDATSYGCTFAEVLRSGAVTAATRNNVDHFSGSREFVNAVGPKDVKWSPRNRVLFILGAVGTLWTGLIGAAVLAL